jgi:hypothetical protein
LRGHPQQQLTFLSPPCLLHCAFLLHGSPEVLKHEVHGLSQRWSWAVSEKAGKPCRLFGSPVAPSGCSAQGDKSFVHVRACSPVQDDK